MPPRQAVIALQDFPACLGATHCPNAPPRNPPVNPNPPFTLWLKTIPIVHVEAPLLLVHLPPPCHLFGGAPHSEGQEEGRRLMITWQREKKSPLPDSPTIHMNSNMLASRTLARAAEETVHHVSVSFAC